MQSIWQTAFDVLFPPTCVGCDKFGEIICKGCQKSFELRQSLVCPGCGKASPYGELHNKCKSDLDGLVGFWRHDASLRVIIHQIKYAGYYESLGLLADIYAKHAAILQNKPFQSFLGTNPIILPIPLHKRRLRVRGFNQAGLFARHLARFWQLRFSKNILQRYIYTTPQAGLSHQKRRQNVANSFKISEKALQNSNYFLGENFILVDDVWTTGSTMKNCAKALKILKPGKIWGLVIAR